MATSVRIAFDFMWNTFPLEFSNPPRREQYRPIPELSKLAEGNWKGSESSHVGL
jgi:hypothetical protein